MSLTKEQINIVKNVESLDELKQKAEENHIKANDALLLDLYNSYHTESELSDEELDNVTGGCGDKVVNQNDPACEHYEHFYGWSDPPHSARNCWFCKHCYSEWEEGKGTTCYCSYDD